MFAAQPFGESANELVAKWGRSGYRYGFPDFYAAEFPVAPMHYDQSRIYSGVIGRHYPNAQTARYHYMYDQNMYLQPGVPPGDRTLGEMSTATSRKLVIGGVLGVLAVAVVGIAMATSAQRRTRDEWDY